MIYYLGKNLAFYFQNKLKLVDYLFHIQQQSCRHQFLQMQYHVDHNHHRYSQVLLKFFGIAGFQYHLFEKYNTQFKIDNKKC